jgi:hypothetical protein
MMHQLKPNGRSAQQRRLKGIYGLMMVAVAVCLWACVAPEKKSGPDVDRIRGNAERAHADLRAEEGYGGGSVSADTGTAGGGTLSAPPVQASDAPLETGRRPEWIDQPGRRFPPSHYMTGVGYGQERPTAEDRARTEIAKIFESDITSENRTYEEYLQSTEGGRSRSAQNFNFEDITTVSTRKILSDIRIAAVYRDDAAYYALAVLDRQHVTPILTDKIAILDREIDQMLNVAESQSDRLTKIRAYKTGIEKYVLRQSYNTELRIVRSDGRGIPSRYTLADIQQRFTQVLLKDFAVMVSVSGDRAADVAQALTEALTQKGFAVAYDSNRAAVFARGQVQIQPVEAGSTQWKFVRWNAYFDLVDRQGGTVFGSVQKNGKEGHLTLAEAEERAVRKIRQVLVTDISNDLTGYILSPPQ